MILEDLIAQGILDGNLYAGNFNAVTAAAGISQFGIYNPKQSGVKAILFSFYMRYCGNQPIANNSAAQPALFTYDHSTTVPVPVGGTRPFNTKVAAGTSQNSPLLAIKGSDGYAAQQGFRLPVFQDIQPNSIYSLVEDVAITTSFPLVLYPGDYFGGCNGTPFASTLGTTLFFQFVQLPA